MVKDKSVGQLLGAIAILIIIGMAILLFGIATRPLSHSFSSPSSESRNQYDCPEIQSEVPAFILEEFRVTAYCKCEKCCGKWADGFTASGHKLESGDKIIAAPMDIPFNTIIEVPGYGYGFVLDRGGVIKGNRLDIYFDTHEEALEWGVQYLKVKVWK